MKIGYPTVISGGIPPKFGKLTVPQMERVLKSEIPTLWSRRTVLEALDKDILMHGQKTSSSEDQQNTQRIKEILEEFLLNKPTSTSNPMFPNDKTEESKRDLADLFAQIMFAEKYAPKEKVFETLMKEFEALG